MGAERAHDPLLSIAKLDAELCALLPDDLKTRIVEFVRYKCSGNVQINIEIGELRGYHINDVVRCRPKS